ncbi:MAG: GGDEF domain-containing protein [Nitrospirae bacterium]|nr:GGDEF domain-containing protein [Nitrospirota bacterium]
MLKLSLIKTIVILSIAAVIALPLYSSLFLYPAFTNILIEGTEENALRVASHLAGTLGTEEVQSRKAITPDFMRETDRIAKELKLTKVKLFSPDGEIVFSTDRNDIGHINTKAYFRDVVAKGRPHTMVLKKSEQSLEDQIMIRDVVETYVPMMENGRFIGAFEIYYDITKSRESLDRLILRSSIFTISVGFGLLIAVLLSSIRATNYLKELKRAEEDMRALSLTDELTGIHNRRGFYTLAEHLVKGSNRTNRGIYILYADLDGLKQINDTMGHKEGDKALIDVAELLRNNYRESDIIARIGGDEFVVLPVGMAGDHTEVIEGRMNRSLEIFNSRQDRLYALSLSYGIGFYDPEKPCSVDELLSKADRLMYEQKMRKKNRCDT